MKHYKAFILFMVAAAISLGSCQKDPQKEVEKGDWNKEKRIISLSFERQAGDASISINADDASRGTIEVTIVNPDLSEPLLIKKMEISYGATASVAAGQTLAFNETTNTAEITVTAATGGASRVYTVSVNPLVENLEGTWEITGMNIFGGTGADYGGVDFVNLFTDASWWNPTTGPAAELDNTLEFVFEGVDDSGCTYGTCTHSAGADGLYADFVWVGSIPDGQTVTDVNYNYRKIPAGESTWKRNYTDGTITFTSADNVTTTCTMVESGTIEYWGKTLTINDNAFKFTGLQSVGSWGPIYDVYDKVVYAPWDFYVQIKKR